jgi:uncharacterized repeat protein (TIGR03847 family)
MPDAHHDFAAVDAIDAESIGTPGKRTFRVRILRKEASASLWVEKQQLAALGEAIPRLLEQLDTPDQHANAAIDPISYFPDNPTVEFKVGRLALGYAAQEDRLVLIAHALESEAEEEEEDDDDEASPPNFTCRFTREQARLLSNSCADAVAGGRPTCPICHRPIDPDGHLCPRANGHQKLPTRGGTAG